MTRRIQEKRAKNKFRKTFAYLMLKEMDVKIKPSRLKVRQEIKPDKVIVYGESQGYELIINFTKAEQTGRNIELDYID